MTLPADKPLAQPPSDHGAHKLSPEAAHDAPVRYAQVTSDSAVQPIGKVETLDGNGTLQHNGNVVAITKGMEVYQGDLVTAGAHSNVGIVFVDKSVFSVNDGGSMTLDDFVYNPAATTSNSMLFNLVKGSAGFITGHVVKTGDMEMGTPVAVIAVRGTTVIVQCPTEVLAHPSCTFQAATGRFDLLVDGKVLTSVGLEAVKVQDGHFSFDLTPKTPDQLQNYNSIINTLQNSASSANIELHKEGGLIETHPIHDVQVEIAFNDGTTYSSPLDTFAAVATIAGASTAGGLPNLTTETNGEEATTTSLASISTTSTGSTPLVSTDNAPVITSGPQSGAVTETADTTDSNTLHMQNGAITFTDADTTDTHTASFASQGSAYLGTFALGAVNDTTGSVAWTFAVQDSALDFLQAGEKLVQTYTVKVNDGHGGTASEVVTVTLTGTNDAPVTTAVAAATDTMTAITGTVVDGTSDVDNNPATDLTYAVVGEAPAGLTFHANGTWTYDPSGNFDTLAHGDTTTVSFDYQANDGMANSNVSTATITVTGANSAPVLSVADTSGQLTEGDGNALLTASSNLSFSDADAVDTVTVSQSYNGDIALSGGTIDSTLAAALVAGFSVSQNGWTYSTTQNLDFLAAGQTITFSYDLVATDNSGAANDASAPTTVTITITGTADVMGSTINGTSGDDSLFGTSGNDLILPGDATAGSGDTIHASAGNDTVDFTGAHNGTYILDYSSLGVNLEANIGPTGGTIDKGSLGTDSLVNFDSINGNVGGVEILGGSGNDTFTANLSSGEALSIQVGTGSDSISVTGNGFVQVDASTYNGAYIDATEGIMNDAGGTSSATVTGIVDEWRGSQSNDTIFGSSGNDSFIPGAGNNSIDGAGGTDLVRYDLGGADSIQAVFTAPGTAMVIGTANGSMFTDTLTNIEAIHGTGGNDIMVGSSGSELLSGLAGNDTLIGDNSNGAGGNDTLLGGAGSDILTAGAGANVLDVGADSNLDFVVFAANALNAGDVADLIANFNTSNDELVVSDLFTVNGGTGDVLSNYVQIQNVGGTTQVQVDANGLTGGHNYSAVIATFDTALSAGTNVNVIYTLDSNNQAQTHVTVI